MEVLNIILIIAAFIIGGGFSVFIMVFYQNKKAKGIIENAKAEGEAIKKAKLLEVKEKYLQLKSEFDKHSNQRSQKLQSIESKLGQKEKQLQNQEETLVKKEAEVEKMRQDYENQLEIAEKKDQELDRLNKEAIERLEAIAGMSAEEAKNNMVESLKAEAQTAALAYSNEIMEEARMNANREAKKVVIKTIQRVATEAAIENAVTVFHIDSDEIKGRIIGREGRNIRALEAATGVEIVVDDTPEAIVLSAFDPVRREIARLALHQLVQDGRIHPARIEEVVNKVTKQIEEEIVETGKRTTIDLGIHGLHPELVRLVGKMRTCYNMLVKQRTFAQPWHPNWDSMQKKPAGPACFTT